jgi:hypothetical protein
MDTPDGELQERVARLARKRPVRWERALGGYTPAERWLVSFDDASSCFLKAATNEWTADALRAEYNVYSQVTADFLPRLVGWDNGQPQPVLLLEDLSPAHWPPPWRTGDIEAVLATLREVRELDITGLPDVRLHSACVNLWLNVEREPEDFLSLGLASAAWLERCLPVLKQAAGAAPFAGDDVVHFDVRSDNLCFDGSRCLLVDWNHASRGNGDLDIATWLPSLEAEGGPAPETLFPRGAELAAWMSGYWAWGAGRPPPPGGPRLREIQRAQLRSSLPWAVRMLGLPPLDGPRAP